MQNDAAREEHHLFKGVARIVLEIEKFAVRNLAFGLLLDGDAAVVMRRRLSVLSDEAENLVLLARPVDDRQSILILNRLPLFVGGPHLPLARRLVRRRRGRRIRCCLQRDIEARNDPEK
ncbi:hypothetical protein [Bradyrhizobium sp. AZCC 2289]|uniref:hypothetical protein n=1 Tax=Bradyrhizobium sp. AZCC 2289 TaxID=3117026 RepID=UPI002FEF1892